MSDANAGPVKRKTRKKGITRQNLMDAALQLLLDIDYDDLLVDDITELADVGRRTFYNHFDNKQACVIAAVSARYKDYAINYKQVSKDTLESELSKNTDHAKIIAFMASQMFCKISYDPITHKLSTHPKILCEAIAGSQRDSIQENVAKGVMAGRFTPSLSVDAIEPILTWGFLGLVLTAIQRSSQAADSVQWASFILQNLGIDSVQATKIIQSIDV